MTITSKYNGKCKQCGGHIGIGDQVEWQKGEGIRHTKCPAAPIPPRPSGERAGARGQSFRPVPKPGQQQARRSYPPKVAAQIVPAVSRSNVPAVSQSNGPAVSRSNGPAVSRSNGPAVSRSNGPYHGKFQLVRQLAETCEAVVGSAALDAEHAAITAPCSRRLQPAKESAAVPGRRTTVTFHMLCPTRTL